MAFSTPSLRCTSVIKGEPKEEEMKEEKKRKELRKEEEQEESFSPLCGCELDLSLVLSAICFQQFF